MELRHLRYFVGVAELEHFGRAAEKLHVSQPALSQQIAELEREIGVTLFERRPRGVRLSEAGAILLARARAILASVDAAVEETQAVAGGRRGRLLIGLPEGDRATTIVRRAVERFRATHAEVELITTAVPWTEQTRELLEERLDVGFAWHVRDIVAHADGENAPHSPGVRWHSLFDDAGCYAMLDRRSPLAHAEQVTLAQLRTRPFALVASDLMPVLHRRLTSALGARGVPAPSITDGVRTAAALAPLLAATDGWVLVTQSVASSPPIGTAMVPIVDFSIPGALDVLWRATDARVSVETFVQYVRDAAVEVGQ